MNINDQGYILIGGTGRAGTTLLVQLLTHLGFNTGYTSAEAEKRIDPISRGGLERRLFHTNLPEVIKSPNLCHDIVPALEAGLHVKAAIIPVRNLVAAAESRRAVSRKAAKRGKNPKTAPGGLWDVDNPQNQERKLAENFYKFLEPLVQQDVPVIMLGFPRFITDQAYFYRQMKTLFAEKNITPDMVAAAYTALVNPELVGATTRNPG